MDTIKRLMTTQKVYLETESNGQKLLAVICRGKVCYRNGNIDKVERFVSQNSPTYKIVTFSEKSDPYDLDGLIQKFVDPVGIKRAHLFIFISDSPSNQHCKKNH